MAITGIAAGVPYLALPASTPGAPVVVGWHLLDSPRTEAAFAAAVPLDGLDAWRIYLGLPLSGSRLPEGGFEELGRLAAEDAVLNVHRPVAYGAAEEFRAAWPELRGRLGFTATRIGVMGGSAGAAAAQLAALESAPALGLEVGAAVLISPVIRLRVTVTGLARQYGMTYEWSPESDEVARRLDFVARAGEFGDTPILAVVGELDDQEAFQGPAAELRAARGESAEVATIPGMGHALADEPGIEPAPQTAHAKEVDALATEWFRRHLGSSERA
ncbi:alpha/beta hydrolase [Spongiactinospora gelatinilytica]|uniref:Alpha/beta hydrolase n=1 Tax=Spongiactinospora gelatinilytica TaxID=2666298 RepID=A0A2W2GTY2_9ACTN|nr:prolyl oligopeptidase family serine peptidase [Spongiactinospora gelatinilytica]PZG40990.1 alpha/beta hydrolase [Spongiactinospora gelatinilytica]